MNKSPLSFLFGAASLAAVALASTPAQAGIDACGDIHVEADAQCEVLFEAACEAECKPVNFTASCAAELEASCGGQCNVDADVACTTDCSGSCMAECDVDPGAFDCSASCFADCEGSCTAYADDNEARASCEATCSANCDAECNLVEPEANCEAQCNACCGGSCTAEINVECQVMCQADGYVDCKASLEGGCTAECQKPEGALFCDGQYVDHGGNLEECVNALRALLDIEVEGYAEGSCSNGSCEGVAGGSITCSVDPEDDEPTKLGWLSLLMVGGAFFGLRRRQA